MARLLVASLLLAAAAPLIAQPAPPPMTMGMAKTMTRGEVQTQIETRFAKRDANRDGFLTSDEMTRGGKRAGGMKMRQQRRMGGQQATRDPDAAFDRLDINRDGSISRDEFANAREARIEKRVVVNQSGQPGATGQRSGMRRGGGGGGGMMGAAMLRMADVNRDGRVSLAEATTGALRQFDTMDANRDGRVTPEERAAGRAQMRQMRRAS